MAEVEKQHLHGTPKEAMEVPRTVAELYKWCAAKFYALENQAPIPPPPPQPEETQAEIPEPANGSKVQ